MNQSTASLGIIKYICTFGLVNVFNYEVEKLFQDGGKKNNFTRSDITGIHVEFESRTNFTFGDNLTTLFDE